MVVMNTQGIQSRRKAGSKTKGCKTEGSSNKESSGILTVAEVAQLKGVTRAAVYAAIAQERLPHLRLLGRKGIREDDARAWQPTRWAGRPQGIPMSAHAKRRISESQKRRWQQRRWQRQSQKSAAK